MIKKRPQHRCFPANITKFLRTACIIKHLKWLRLLLGRFSSPFLTLLFPVFPFDPPENIRKPLVFWFFQGNWKGTLRRKGLTIFLFPYNSFFIRIYWFIWFDFLSIFGFLGFCPYQFLHALLLWIFNFFFFFINRFFLYVNGSMQRKKVSII